MPSGVYKRTKRNKQGIYKANKFRKSVEELREFTKENDIKLLEFLKYMRRKNDKKIKKVKYGTRQKVV